MFYLIIFKKWINYLLFYSAVIKESFIMKDYYELNYYEGLHCGFMLKRASHESCRQNYCEYDTCSNARCANTMA